MYAVPAAERYLSEDKRAPTLDDLRAIFSQTDDANVRQKHSVLYEYAVAIKMGLHLWNNLPEDVLSNNGFILRSGGVTWQDNGIDAASADLKTTMQAKWYGPRTKISLEAVAKFHFLSDCCKADRRVLVSPPGVKFGKATCENRDEMFSRDYVSDQEAFEILAALYPLDSRPPVVADICAAVAGPAKFSTLAAMIDDMHDFQREAFDKIVANLHPDREVERQLCKVACGGGKSWLIIALAARWCAFKRGRVIIMAPSKIIAHQLRDDMRQLLGLRCGMVGDSECNLSEDITICIYNSVVKIEDICDDNTLVLCDEGHHPLRHVVDFDDNASIASDASIASNATNEDRCGFLSRCYALPGKHVYYTATVSQELPEEVVEVVNISMPELVEKGHLVDYRVWVPLMSTEEQGDTKRALARIVVNNPEWTHILAFCNSIKCAEEFAVLLNSFGVRSVVLTGRNSIAERKRALAQLASREITCIVSVNIFAEGLNPPEARTIIFVDQRSSPDNLTQCIGRVQRKCSECLGSTGSCPHKQIAHVVLPATHEAALPDFIETMMSNDPRLKEAVSEKKGGRVSFACSERTSMSAKNSPEAEADIIALDVYDSLGRMCESSWDRWLSLMVEYIQEKNMLPKRPTIFKNMKLGNWQKTQRRNFKKGKLSAKRIQQLEALPGWKWKEDSFQANLSLLLEYIRKNNTLPPQSAPPFKGIKLGIWLSSQRQNYKKGKLSAEQIQQFEALPKWEWKVENPFPANLVLMSEYIQEKGTLPPQSAPPFKGIKLGAWLCNQRQDYRKGKLSDRQIQQLEALPGWKWKVESTFLANLVLMREYIQEKGTLPKRSTPPFKGINLSKWQNKHRVNYKKGKLSTERIQQLETLPGWKWEEDPFPASLALMAEYIREKGMLPKSSTSFKGMRLGAWQSTQRQDYKKGKLSAERIQQLETLPGWKWEEDPFPASLSLMAEYIREKGMLPKSSTSFKGMRLGVWMTKQRQNFRKGKLSAERIQQLEALPEWKWEGRT